MSIATWFHNAVIATRPCTRTCGETAGWLEPLGNLDLSAFTAWSISRLRSSAFAYNPKNCPAFSEMLGM